jgi:metallo-beta-lactamase family protein
MAKRKKEKSNIKIKFVGKSADSVTGSMIYIETFNKKILLECGLFQSNSIKDDYKINSKKFEFDPAKLDYVFINHAHADHSCLTPRLLKEGFDGKIITTPATAKILEVMFYDSAHIIESDAERLSKMNGYTVEPLYYTCDVQAALEHMYEYGYDDIHVLDECISFKFLRNCHIFGAAQLELYIKDELGVQKTILYTSDLGNASFKNYYTEDTEYCTKANIVIAENTYGSSERTIKKKDRDTDIEKIRSAIDTVTDFRCGRVLIPSFSLHRTPTIMTIIYELFHEDSMFDVPVIVDSPLSNKLLDVYRNNLEGEDRVKFEEVMNWKNFRFVTSYEESKMWQMDKKPKVVIASSGNILAGRSVSYTKEFITHTNDMILFIGFSPENSIATKIKQGKNKKTITIEGKQYKNRCDIMDLRSFSSHIQRDGMLDYYSNIKADLICLVHADMDSKIEFKKSLEEELSKKGKTTRVIAVNKDTVCNI